ncbi:MAG: pyridoxamine kinase [Oscillospiraceae bacterium]|jgi:pyridoxine kinase|nr:pyridoxamine kinase [Oscillospiraceae bacterium]
MGRQKRLAAVHDISCFGRCSLTVALPIISAAGIEVSCVPTAVLSTHTGGFTDYTYRDLTEDMPLIIAHWEKLALEFDAIYTGYLGSFAQLDIVADMFDRLAGEETAIVVDPVMADNGKLYPAFSSEFPAGMRKLCSQADVIVPNMTEAALLLDEPYKEGPYTEKYIDGIVERLTGLGPQRVVLTGVYFDDELLGAAYRDGGRAETRYMMARKVPGSYHGTGDVFASALAAGTVNGLAMEAAVRAAVDFTVGSIERTHRAGTDIRYGVDFETCLPDFIRDVLTQ